MNLTVDRISKQYKNKIAVDRVHFILPKVLQDCLGLMGLGKQR